MRNCIDTYFRAALVLSVVAMSTFVPVDAAIEEAPLDAVHRRYPPTETNAAAHDVERLALPLGIRVSRYSTWPPSATDPLQPGPKDVAAVELIETLLSKWFGSSSRTWGIVPTPPQEVAAFLASRADALEMLRRAVLRGEAPSWGQRLEDDARIPEQNEAGTIRLHKILLADALLQQLQGRHETALQDVETSWRLNEPLQNTPYFGLKRISFFVTTLHVSTLLHLDPVPKIWRDRLIHLRPVTSMLGALRTEITLWPERYSEARYARNTMEKLKRRISDFYVVSCMESASERYLERLERIDPERAFCDREYPDASIMALRNDLPFWNRVQGLLDDDADAYLQRASRQAFAIELAIKILDLRAARDANGGRWLRTYPGIETSTTCPDDFWKYRVTRQGIASLEFSRPLRWKPRPLEGSLTRFEEGPRQPVR